MKKFIGIAAIAAALTFVAALGGCAVKGKKEPEKEENGIVWQLPEEPFVDIPVVQLPGGGQQDEPEIQAAKTVSYVKLLSDGVNLRSGAGTSYPVKGSAEKSTMYALEGSSGGWYKTNYKNGAAYLSSKYCELVEMHQSDNARIEAVIAEGTKLLGTPYVYGAVRYHDGNGKLMKNFSINAFDCSSLTQYIFYKGANAKLDVTSRAQSTQGKTVSKANLQRGDLMFFTNASRRNNTGLERIGHVALYLGDNWILHTASDYAKIEQISSTRWSYFIKAQRII